MTDKANYPLLNINLPAKPTKPVRTDTALLLIFSAVGFLGIIFAAAIGSLTLTFLTAFIALAAVTFFLGQDYMKEVKYKVAYEKWEHQVDLFTASRIQPLVEKHLQTVFEPEGRVSVNNNLLPYLTGQVKKQTYNETTEHPVEQLIVGVTKRNGTEKVYNVSVDYTPAEGVTIITYPYTVTDLLNKQN